MTSSPTTSGPVGRSQLIGSPEGRGAIGPPAAAVVLLPLPASLMAPRIARDDFPLFLELVFAKLNPGIPLARGWYLSAMTQALAEVESGAVRRLQITVPPRHLKSIMVSIAYPAWLLGRRPATRIICASYSQDLATALAGLDIQEYEAEQQELKEIIEVAKEHAEHISGSDITHQREHFDMLSVDIKDLLAITGTDRKLYQAHCPMYNENKGAIWLSETAEIKNPYFGSKMLNCGSVQAEIE